VPTWATGLSRGSAVVARSRRPGFPALDGSSAQTVPPTTTRPTAPPGSDTGVVETTRAPGTTAVLGAADDDGLAAVEGLVAGCGAGALDSRATPVTTPTVTSTTTSDTADR
jgi:hypothetical protein